MKSIRYEESNLSSNIYEEIDSAKQEDETLPFFSKEVPLSSERKVSGNSVEVKYFWNHSETPSIKVQKIIFSKTENLGDLYRIDKMDGTDVVTLERSGKTYVLRKTSAEIAKALYNVAERIGHLAERVIGYLKTLLGNFYVISLIDEKAWTFDKRLSAECIIHLDINKLKPHNRKRLVELVVEKLSSLHLNNLILGGFTLNNVLILNDDIKFTDLRGLRAIKNSTLAVEEFREALRYLLSIGLAGPEDITAAAAYYSSENNESCREWYSTTTGKKRANDEEIASQLEILEQS